MTENVSQELASDQVEQNSLEPHPKQEEQLKKIQRDMATVFQKLNVLERKVGNLETQRNVPGHSHAPVQQLSIPPEL
jgi:ABC-type phosphate/phosphonate transport system ATPase subunit